MFNKTHFPFLILVLLIQAPCVDSTGIGRIAAMRFLQQLRAVHTVKNNPDVLVAEDESSSPHSSAHAQQSTPAEQVSSSKPPVFKNRSNWTYVDQELTPGEQMQINAAFIKAASSKIGTAGLISLLSQGADLHARDKQGRTALHLAAYVGAPDVVAFLLREGISADHKAPAVTIPENEGAATPLDYAQAPHALKAGYQREEIIQLLTCAQYD